jgi:hypothetical protein
MACWLFTLNLYAICCKIYSLFALKLCSFLLLNIWPVDCLLWTCMLYAVTYIGSLLWNCTAFCCNTYGLFTICLLWTCMAICCSIYIQYWCIDGKYRIYVTRLRNGGKTSFSEFFHLFRAEPHESCIYHQYTNIVFILQQNLSKKNVILFNNKKKITETPIDTSIVVPVRGVT